LSLFLLSLSLSLTLNLIASTGLVGTAIGVVAVASGRSITLIATVNSLGHLLDEQPELLAFLWLTLFVVLVDLLN